MKNQETKTSQPTLFQQLEARLKAEGFSDDHLEIDRILIETRNCKCGRFLNYKGLSNAIEYAAYEWCECGYVGRREDELCVVQRRSGKYKKTVQQS